MNIIDIPYINQFTENKNYPQIDFVTSDCSKIRGNTLYIFTKRSTSESRSIPGFSTTPAVIVCEEDDREKFDLPFVVTVKNARRALSFASAKILCPELEKLKIIGVTGTNGKTTTAYTLYSILCDAGKRTLFIGTGLIELMGAKLSDKNYSMTTPDPEYLFEVLNEAIGLKADYVVMEVSSHSIALEKIAPIRFNVGIFTNLSDEHMDFHKTIDNYLETKLRLFDNCDVAVLNNDDFYIRSRTSKIKTRTKTVGALFDGNARIHTLKDLGANGSNYIYSEKNFSFRTRINLPGIYNIYNTALAIAASLELGIQPCHAKMALKKLKGIYGRFEIINSEVKVIIDYAHTPHALSNFLSAARKCTIAKRLIAVFGCGGERDRTKRPLMAAVAEKYADIIIVTDDNSRNEDKNQIINDIIAGFKSEKKVKVIHGREKAIEWAIKTANNGDAVAIIGKGPEAYNLDSDGYHDFDERAIIKRVLKERAGGMQ